MRVIAPDSKILGSFNLDQAIEKAKSFNLDLVQVGFNNGVAVCKILDYSKYKYALLKKLKQNKNKKIKIKEIKLRPNTDTNDINIKLKATKNSISQGHKVKISLILKGREMIHENIARNTLANFKQNALKFCRIENDLKKEGKILSILLIGKK